MATAVVSLAKNLLEDKTCDNCLHYQAEAAGIEIECCLFKVSQNKWDFSIPLDQQKRLIVRVDTDIPKERTCENWEKDSKELRMQNLFATFKKKAKQEELIKPKHIARKKSS
jgi:hypothetical protein